MAEAQFPQQDVPPVPYVNNYQSILVLVSDLIPFLSTAEIQ